MFALLQTSCIVFGLYFWYLANISNSHTFVLTRYSGHFWAVDISFHVAQLHYHRHKHIVHCPRHTLTQWSCTLIIRCFTVIDSLSLCGCCFWHAQVSGDTLHYTCCELDLIVEFAACVLDMSSQDCCSAWTYNKSTYASETVFYYL